MRATVTLGIAVGSVLFAGEAAVANDGGSPRGAAGGARPVAEAEGMLRADDAGRSAGRTVHSRPAAEVVRGEGREARPRTANVTEVVGEVVGGVAGTVRPVTRALGGSVESAGKATASLTEALGSPAAPLTGALEPVAGVVEPVTRPVGSVLDPLTRPVGAALSPVTAPVTEAVAPITRPVTRVLAPVVDVVDPVVGGVVALPAEERAGDAGPPAVREPVRGANPPGVVVPGDGAEPVLRPVVLTPGKLAPGAPAARVSARELGVLATPSSADRAVVVLRGTAARPSVVVRGVVPGGLAAEDAAPRGPGIADPRPQQVTATFSESPRPLTAPASDPGVAVSGAQGSAFPLRAGTGDAAAVLALSYHSNFAVFRGVPRERAALHSLAGHEVPVSPA